MPSSMLTIVGLKGQDLEVRFAENVKLTLARSAVARVMAGEGVSEPAATPLVPS